MIYVAFTETNLVVLRIGDYQTRSSCLLKKAYIYTFPLAIGPLEHLLGHLYLLMEPGNTSPEHIESPQAKKLRKRTMWRMEGSWGGARGARS